MEFYFPFEDLCRKHLPFYSFLSLFFIIYLFTYDFHDENCFFELDYPHFSGVYFAVIVVSPQNQTRIETAYRSWGCSIHFFSPESLFIPVSSVTLSKFQDRTLLYTSPSHATRVNTYLYGFKKGMKDFIENTSLKWFIRTTDDVYVNIPNFATLLNELESKYDPLQDKVVKGHLVGSYLHGGCGWIMSRKAVEEVLKIWDKVNPKHDLPDDVIASSYFNKAGIDLTLMISKRFLGSPISLSSIELLDHHMWNKIKPCYQEPEFRLNDIAVWHAGSQSMSIVVYGNELMEKMPKQLSGFINSNGKIDLCIK